MARKNQLLRTATPVRQKAASSPEWPELWRAAGQTSGDRARHRWRDEQSSIASRPTTSRRPGPERFGDVYCGAGCPGPLMSAGRQRFFNRGMWLAGGFSPGQNAEVFAAQRPGRQMTEISQGPNRQSPPECRSVAGRGHRSSPPRPYQALVSAFGIETLTDPCARHRPTCGSGASSERTDGVRVLRQTMLSCGLGRSSTKNHSVVEGLIYIKPPAGRGPRRALSVLESGAWLPLSCVTV